MPETSPRATPLDKLWTGLGGLIPAYACLSRLKWVAQESNQVLYSIMYLTYGGVVMGVVDIEQVLRGVGSF